MKFLFNISFLLSLLLSFINTSTCQSETRIDSTVTQLIQSASEIMIAAKVCALITLDQEGRPRVRAMDPFHPGENLVVWFGTNPLSRKVQQIKTDPRVTLYYLDEDSSGYVMLHGKAELVSDPKAKIKYWKDAWKAFYPKYPYDYILIKVVPEWMEVISNSRGITGDSVSWKPPVVTFDSIH